MSTLNTELPTLVDLARMTNPDGSVAQLVEMATRRNVFLKDMVWKEANNITGHRITSRYALPSPGYRRFNEGVARSKGRTRQFDETCGMMESVSEVDRDLARINGNVGAYRLAEDKAHFAAMNNTFETNVAYSSAASAPEQFHGLIPRLDATTLEAGGQIVLAEADDTGSDYTSILLVGWGPQTVYGIYPKGSAQGIETIDLGEQMVVDSGGTNRFLALSTMFKWHHGIAVEDWRYLSRVANIDSGALAATDDILVPAMIQAINKLESTEGVRPVFYCNRTVYTYLWLQARNATKNSTLSVEKVEGQEVAMLNGIPIRRTDAITNTEDGIA